MCFTRCASYYVLLYYEVHSSLCVNHAHSPKYALSVIQIMSQTVRTDAFELPEAAEDWAPQAQKVRI